jgi:hypothetical protein
MKIKLLAILTLTLFNLKSFSQQYFPLLNNSSWIIVISDFGGNVYREYNQSSDVIIGSTTYKKYIGQTNEEYLLREDVAAKKVYKLINGNDVLLYDFSLQISDNITLDDGQNYQVQSITTINVTGGQRRQFYLKNLNPFWAGETWIEGVGRYTHPLLAKSEFFSDPAFTLQCSFQNGVNIFNQGIANGGTATNCSLSVEDQNYLSEKILFAPNPFDNELIISSQTSLNNSTLKVFNSIGQKVREINNINGEKYILQRENLSKGLYLFQLSENGKELAAKKLMIK